MAPGDLAEWVSYNPVSGLMRWKQSPNQRIKIGALVGGISDQGYLRFKLDGVEYRVSRAAWAITYGYWPNLLVEHQDGDKLNNRLGNLRLSTEQENMRNAKARHDGLKGTTYRTDRDGWVASIRVDNKSTYLGTYGTEEQAHAAYCKEALRLFGDFVRFK